MSASGYSEIPGVFTESPRPLATFRRTLRNYRYCIAATLMIALVITLASLVSLLIGASLDTTDIIPPAVPPANQSLVTLMALTWPRRDQLWYTRRWERSVTMTPDDPHKRQYDDDPLIPDDPDGHEWSIPDHSTFPNNDTWYWTRRPSKLPEWSSLDISESLTHGSKKEQQKTLLEEDLAKKNLTLVPGSPSYKHQHGFKKTDPLATKMAKLGYLMDHATTKLKDRMNLTREAASLDSRWVGDMSSTPYCDKDLQRPLPGPCNASGKYRSVDGTCNNLKNPTWGASFTPFRRALPPDYGDGVWSLRLASDGEELPSARLVSSKVHLNTLANSRSYTILTMSWGQFVDHDITLTALSKASGGQSIPCCSDEVLKLPSLYHPECAPIPIPAEDSFYAAFNQSCMEFTRSAPAPRCHFGPREQLNQQTAFLDGSVIYGATEQHLSSLRTFQDGLLRSQVTLDGRELLPASEDPDDGCNTIDEYSYSRYCFTSGDARVNEQTLLTSLHTVWARQHNMLAIELKDLNPEWDDETLFQEARRIVVAQMQHITYNEYVPSLIGPTFMKHLQLSPQSEGKQTTDYDENLSPTIANEFAAAAFRFGHSQIQGLVQKIDGPGKNVEFTQLNSIMLQPFILYDQGTMANLLRGQTSQSAAAVDTFFSTQVSGKLFKGDDQFGLDLVSLNIQRGRDHGVSAYNRWRMYCGFKPASNFTDLAQDMDAGALKSIMEVYRNVDDIDFFTGGLAERPVNDGLVGPTFACLIADQFLRLKKGDRFWYETADLPQAFTKEQLAELHKVSIARILCDNVPELGSIQRWPLRNFATGNPRLPCSSTSIPRVDLDPWENDQL
ncbi:hypothetical protein OTU49_016263 [Cherax quadricarinatus]|uniref:Uncharacterized protein n=1 Tax=Cherax quadricarinatus TaxID=27406 RepID=A0AAW0Y5G7_CHEQU